ncbi:Actin-related protein 2/3 complex subunit 2 [Trichinella pseudospiralis]|uniref:Actin-related protein 2/3 complex subunit 2 n=2 Tax=Trichinella pseudospiralis TaxID=6337 RepID=A0A0V1G0Q4_TRIPS|nr:Actin-related protein 2/3 complex subunit 2 [Trichinella pseudospiralis]KRZ33451.1 Actin-related protein 2/3 complex subunit 2 [Trichinella pseudospiralis]
MPAFRVQFKMESKSFNEVTEFIWKLFQKIKNSKRASECIFLSPMSVLLAVGMAYFGAAGKTKLEIQRAIFGDAAKEKDARALFVEINKILTTKSINFNKMKLLVANCVYIQEGFKLLTPYVEEMKKISSDIIEVDFMDIKEARLVINQWICNKTERKIENLIPPNLLQPITTSVIANAIYFKAQWSRRFEVQNTVNSDFFCDEIRRIKVKMMRDKQEFYYYENEICQLLGISYKENNFWMYILLPKQRFALQEMENSLTSNQLAEMFQNGAIVDVTVKIPKFSFTSASNMKDVLTELGMGIIFDGENADFSKICKRKDIFVSDILHKAFLEVNEEGTEAAAATAVTMTDKAAAMPSKQLFFVADHPFLFLICNPNFSIPLFLGRYTGLNVRTMSKATIMLDSNNKFITEALSNQFSNALAGNRLESVNFHFKDFDGVAYHMSNPNDDKNKIMLSIYLSYYEELQEHGINERIRQEYGIYVAEKPEPQYNISLIYDLTEIPQKYDDLIFKAARLKRNCLASVFEKYFEFQERGDAGQNRAVIHYREDETMYVEAKSDRVTVIFSTVFNDPADIIIGKIFLQEIHGKRASQTAPQVIFSLGEPPLELKNSNARISEGIGYVTFVLLPKHTCKASRDNTIDLLSIFRSYLHYHIKGTKAFIQSRMRSKTDEFLKILNRAKPKVIPERKTIMGRTFEKEE